jgi:hypothetical protein
MKKIKTDIVEDEIIESEISKEISLSLDNEL